MDNPKSMEECCCGKTSRLSTNGDIGETPFAQLNPEKYPVGSEIYKILNPVTKIKEVLAN